MVATHEAVVNFEAELQEGLQRLEVLSTNWSIRFHPSDLPEPNLRKIMATLIEEDVHTSNGSRRIRRESSNPTPESGHEMMWKDSAFVDRTQIDSH